MSEFDDLMAEHPNWSKLEIFRAGRKLQQEKDALKALNWGGILPDREGLAKAIREQGIE